MFTTVAIIYAVSIVIALGLVGYVRTYASGNIPPRRMVALLAVSPFFLAALLTLAFGSILRKLGEILEGFANVIGYAITDRLPE
jgi:VIT1/CCC1 family predicted Fe2+/Mn2+ transporter